MFPLKVSAEYSDQPVSLCLSVGEHISGTAGPIFMKFCVPIPCGRGSVLLWRRCATLCTSGFMDDVTFSRNGRDAESDVCECLFEIVIQNTINRESRRLDSVGTLSNVESFISQMCAVRCW